jgi:hypothetical protein
MPQPKSRDGFHPALHRAQSESVAMSDDKETGAAYLASLKHPATAPAAAAAPARAPENLRPSATGAGIAGPSGGTNFAGTEKRRSPRYKCQGSARLQQAGTSVATWATFTDISMSGCYVEATSTYCAGATLGMKLEANGFRIEATGEVRVAYPQLGMGISFTRMSDEDREHLRGLLRTISPSSVILSSRRSSRESSEPPIEALPAIKDPAAILQAMWNFFEDRHLMGREEFLRILRKSV